MFKHKSFTIIEVLLATSIFALMVIVTVGIFLFGPKTKQRVYQIKEIEDNSRYVIELISKEIGTAKSFADDERPSMDIGLYKGPTEIDFTNSSDVAVKYCRSDELGNCSDTGDTGDYLAKNGAVLTSSKVKITNLAFNVNEFGSSLFECGDPVTFTYKDSSVTYETVLNPTTGECWMKRNLGALQVAQTFNDYLAYGDLFQWGRLDDGHQSITWTSSTTGTPDHGSTTDLSSTDDPGHNNFIYGMGSPYDWLSPQNDNLWQGVSGINNPCPSGWRIPTYDEWNTERASWSQRNRDGAYTSPLKLVAAGGWYYNFSWLGDVGNNGYYWSSTVSTTNARFLSFSSDWADVVSAERAYGFSVRCIYGLPYYSILQPKVTILMTVASATDPSISFSFQNTISLKYGSQ